MDDVIEGVVEEVLDGAAYPWEAEYLTDSEWWDMAFDVVARSFAYVTDNEFLRRFAVLALLSIVVGLLSYMIRAGQRP